MPRQITNEFCTDCCNYWLTCYHSFAEIISVEWTVASSLSEDEDKKADILLRIMPLFLFFLFFDPEGGSRNATVVVLVLVVNSMQWSTGAQQSFPATARLRLPTQSA